MTLFIPRIVTPTQHGDRIVTTDYYDITSSNVYHASIVSSGKNIAPASAGDVT